MKSIGINVDKGKFADYMASSAPWFGETLPEVFEDIECGNNKNSDGCEGFDSYRRIDHILSDIYTEGNKIIINVQQGDEFIDGLSRYVPIMNLAIRKKLENFFIIKEINYFL